MIINSKSKEVQPRENNRFNKPTDLQMRNRLPPRESRLENFCVRKIDTCMYLKKSNRAINFLSPRLETRTTRLETRKTRLETRYSKFSSFEDRGSSRVVRVSSDCQLTFDRYCILAWPTNAPSSEGKIHVHNITSLELTDYFLA